MNEKDIAEQSYKNGYEQAVKDLISHLQGLKRENEQLKCDTYRTSWKSKFLEVKKENDKQKKYIEYLRCKLDRENVTYRMEVK